MASDRAHTSTVLGTLNSITQVDDCYKYIAEQATTRRHRYTLKIICFSAVIYKSSLRERAGLPYGFQVGGQAVLNDEILRFEGYDICQEPSSLTLTYVLCPSQTGVMSDFGFNLG